MHSSLPSVFLSSFIGRPTGSPGKLRCGSGLRIVCTLLKGVVVHTGHSSQLVSDAKGRNAQFLTIASRSDLVRQVEVHGANQGEVRIPRIWRVPWGRAQGALLPWTKVTPSNRGELTGNRNAQFHLTVARSCQINNYFTTSNLNLEGIDALLNSMLSFMTGRTISPAQPYEITIAKSDREDLSFFPSTPHNISLLDSSNFF